MNFHERKKNSIDKSQGNGEYPFRSFQNKLPVVLFCNIIQFLNGKEIWTLLPLIQKEWQYLVKENQYVLKILSDQPPTYFLFHKKQEILKNTLLFSHIKISSYAQIFLYARSPALLQSIYRFFAWLKLENSEKILNFILHQECDEIFCETTKLKIYCWSQTTERGRILFSKQSEGEVDGIPGPSTDLNMNLQFPNLFFVNLNQDHSTEKVKHFVYIYNVKMKKISEFKLQFPVGFLSDFLWPDQMEICSEYLLIDNNLFKIDVWTQSNLLILSSPKSDWRHASSLFCDHFYQHTDKNWYLVERCKEGFIFMCCYDYRSFQIPFPSHLKSCRIYSWQDHQMLFCSEVTSDLFNIFSYCIK